MSGGAIRVERGTAMKHADSELSVIRRILRMLGELPDDAARLRVVQYVYDRRNLVWAGSMRRPPDTTPTPTPDMFTPEPPPEPAPPMDAAPPPPLPLRRGRLAVRHD